MTLPRAGCGGRIKVVSQLDRRLAGRGHCEIATRDWFEEVMMGRKGGEVRSWTR